MSIWLLPLTIPTTRYVKHSNARLLARTVALTPHTATPVQMKVDTSMTDYCYSKCPSGTTTHEDPVLGPVCVESPQFWTTPSIIVFVLALIALALFLISLAFMPKPRRNSQSFIVLLFPVEWLSMILLIPNLFVVRTLSLLGMSVGTFFALIVMGVFFNHTYLGFLEDNLKSVQRHKRENRKSYGLAKTSTFIIGLYMAKLHSSGIFRAKRAEFAELPQYRINLDRFVMMGMLASLMQIATDIYGLYDVYFRRDAYGLLILNLVFNVLLLIALLLDLLFNKSQLAKKASGGYGQGR